MSRKTKASTAEVTIVAALQTLRWGNIDLTEEILIDWLRTWAPEGLENAGGPKSRFVTPHSHAMEEWIDDLWRLIRGERRRSG